MKELNEYDFPDTIKEYEDSYYVRTVNLTRKNFMILVDKVNELITEIEDLKRKPNETICRCSRLLN